MQNQFAERDLDVTLVSADSPARLARWRADQRIGCRMLADENHAVADQHGLAISRQHPSARMYRDGFIQPGMFAFRGELKIYEFIQQPKLMNGYGALRRPGPAALLAVFG